MNFTPKISWRLFLTALVLLFTVNSRLIADVSTRPAPAWASSPAAPCHPFPLKITSRRYAANRVEEAKNHTLETLESATSLPLPLYPFLRPVNGHFGESATFKTGSFLFPLRV